MAKADQLSEIISPVVTSLGFLFWGLEYVSQGRNSIIRIFIDSDEGIGIEDCAKVSHQVSAIMDVEDPISGEYTLEVSSPGMDRLLFTLEQFKAHLNNIVELRLRMPFEGRRKFKGQLTGVEGDEIVIYVDNEEYLLPIDSIDRAQVVPQFKD